MSKLTIKLPYKKVQMKDVVSPTPSKTALRVLKNALEKSYNDQQTVRQRASSLRNN